MKSETLIKSEGFNVLFDKLGMVDAERFIMLISREKEDYTIWQRNLWSEKSFDEVSELTRMLEKQALSRI